MKINDLNKKSTEPLFFPDPGAPVDIFGGNSPCCVTESEVRRLEREYSEPGRPCDLMQYMHEASAAEVAEYGTNN